MMSKEELMKLKEDVTEIQERLKELTDEELEQVFGGNDDMGFKTIDLNKTVYGIDFQHNTTMTIPG